MFNKTQFWKWFDKNFEITSNNKIKVKGKVSTFRDENDIYTSYRNVLEAASIDVDFTEDELRNEIKTKYTVKVKPKSTQIQDWMISRLSNKQECPYNITHAGRTIEYRSGDAITNADINNLENWLIMENDKDNGGPGYAVGTIKATVDNVLKKWESFAVENIMNDIKFDSSKCSILEQYIEDLYNYWQIVEDKEIFSTLMKQWFWCVKRKIWNKDVRHHIWINFYGTTGFGKSEFIHRLTNRFEDFRAEGGLEIFADQGREYKKFCNNFILFFDELSQNNQTSLADAKLNENTLAAIKQSITGKEMDIRILGGQQQNKVKIRYTPISSANYHLYDIIYDPTSMRRFFEFNIGRTTEPGRKDYTYLNSILEKTTEAMKGIDENNDEGYFSPETDVGKKIRDIQRKYLPTKTTVNAWIRKCNVKAGNTSSDLLYNEYKAWCKEYGYNPRNIDGYNEILATRFSKNENGEILIDLGKSNNIMLEKLNMTEEQMEEINNAVL